MKKNLFEKIAKKNKTTADEVRLEMETAIEAAWQNNSKIRELFKSKPTPEEFIAMIANGINPFEM